MVIVLIPVGAILSLIAFLTVSALSSIAPWIGVMAAILVVALFATIILKSFKVPQRYRFFWDCQKLEAEEKSITDAERNEFLKKHGEKTPREFAKVPKSVSFTKDNLPYDSNTEEKYGTFTLYMAPSGKCFHRDPACCRSGNVKTYNLVELAGKVKPCSKCAKDYYDKIPPWYPKYTEYIEKTVKNTTQEAAISKAAEKYGFDNGYELYGKMKRQFLWKHAPELVFMGIGAPVGAVIGVATIISYYSERFSSAAPFVLYVLAALLGAGVFLLIAHYTSVFLGLNSFE